MRIETLTIDNNSQVAVFLDDATGVSLTIPLSDDDIDIIEAAMEAIVSRVLEVMKNG